MMALGRPSAAYVFGLFSLFIMLRRQDIGVEALQGLGRCDVLLFAWNVMVACYHRC